MDTDTDAIADADADANFEFDFDTEQSLMALTIHTLSLLSGTATGRREGRGRYKVDLRFGTGRREHGNTGTRREGGETSTYYMCCCLLYTGVYTTIYDYTVDKQVCMK